MKRSSKILAIVFSALLFIAAIGGAAASALSYVNMSKLAGSIEAANANIENTKSTVGDVNARLNEVSASVDDIKSGLLMDEDVAQENDVRIASEYWIRDTSAISDAYKSGDPSSLDDRQKETLKMASDLLGEIISEGMTDYEKEEAVYRWLTTSLNSENGMLTVIPTTSEGAGEPFGVLKYRNAVCVGFATTFRLLMQMLDIECMVVHDTSLSHSWDLVELENEWYHVDCYFDTGCSYRHFNLDDTSMSDDHSWNREFFPKANGKKYSYALQNAVVLDDVYALPQFAADCAAEKKHVFSCTFSKLEEEDVPVALYLAGRIEEMINGYYADVLFEKLWVEEDGVYTLCMYMTDTSGGSEAELDDDLRDNAEKVLEDAFGDVYYPSDDFGPVFGGVRG